MESSEFKNVIIAAIDGALVSRGKRKGCIKSTCPPMGLDSAAAWQALIAHANPYKLGIGHMIFFTERQHAIFNAIDESLKGLDLRQLDKDSSILTDMGVW